MLTLTPVHILAGIALLLAVISMFPQAASYPLLSVSVALLAIALLLR